MNKLLLIFVVVICIINSGLCLRCYKCNAVSTIDDGMDDCATGRVMEKEDCLSRDGYVCTEFKYGFTIFNTTAYGTNRGCQKVSKGNICEAQRLEAKKYMGGLIKLRGCYICDKELCNAVIRKRY